MGTSLLCEMCKQSGVGPNGAAGGSFCVDVRGTSGKWSTVPTQWLPASSDVSATDAPYANVRHSRRGLDAARTSLRRDDDDVDDDDDNDDEVGTVTSRMISSERRVTKCARG